MNPNDVLDRADSFEQRLSAGLAHLADADPVAVAGRFDPDVLRMDHRVEGQIDRRLVALAAAAVVSIVAVGAVQLVRDAPGPSVRSDQPTTLETPVDTSIVDHGASTTAEPTVSEAPAITSDASLIATPLAAAQMPVVVMDGASTTYAYSDRYGAPFSGGFEGSTVLVPVDAPFDMPRVAISVVDRSAANGNEALVLADLGEPIDVAGTTGYLSTQPSDSAAGNGDPSLLLFFDLDPGRYVLVSAAGISVEDMMAIVDTFDPDSGAVTVPAGLRALPMPDHDINQTVEFQYDLDGQGIGLVGSSRGMAYLLGDLGNSITSTMVVDGIDVGLRAEVGNPDRVSVFWLDGDWAFQTEVTSSDPAAIAELLHRFRLVDDTTFDTTVVGSDVVTGSTRSADVDAMLADVDLPPSFDLGALTDRQGANIRYQEIAEVSGAVACGWLEEYFDNLDTDPARARAAAEALGRSREWSMLLEIADEGGWSGAVWETAAAVNGEGQIATGAGWQAATRENTYPGLGCDER